MIPVIQSDPATMALTYDAQLISGGDQDGLILNAVAAVVGGDARLAVETVFSIDDPALQDRAVQIVSAFWHEKRHFLDFMLTNYGAFRFRQFLDVYVNLPAILQMGKERGVLHAPLEIYNDPDRAELMGIEDIPAELAQIAEALGKRRQMIERDRSPINSRLGLIELSGEALLESLAFLVQLNFVSTFFGLDGTRRFYDSLFNREHFSAKYLTVLKMAVQFGIVPAAPEDEVLQVDTTLLECVLVAALQTEHVPGGGTANSTSMPGERFAAICLHLVQSRSPLLSKEIGSLDFKTCWQAVDDSCLTLFGCNVATQMREDINHFRKQVRERIEGNIPDDLESMIGDYFELRERLIDEFEADPQLFISPHRFTQELADRLLPNYVLAASGGVIGDPPEGYERLMGYRHEEGDVDQMPYLKWWWACVPSDVFLGRAMQDASRGALGFSHPKAWYSVMDFYAPIAKLLMNGRRIRTLLGPELLFAEQRLKNMLSIEVEFYPSFAFPQESFSADIYYYYYGRDQLKCDLTSAQLSRPEGKALAPWTLRRWPRLGRHIIDKLGGGDVAYFTFVRDWSPWVVSDAAFQEIEPYMN